MSRAFDWCECSVCGRSFDRLARPRSADAVCSFRCWVQLRPARVGDQVECQVCGVFFPSRLSPVGAVCVCSVACARELRAGEGREAC